MPAPIQSFYKTPFCYSLYSYPVWYFFITLSLTYFSFERLFNVCFLLKSWP
jgi:hypothetical protein